MLFRLYDHLCACNLFVFLKQTFLFGFQTDAYYCEKFGSNVRQFQIPGIAEWGVVELLMGKVYLVWE